MDHLDSVPPAHGLIASLAADLDACLWTPERLVSSEAWASHIPFAFWLVGALRPRVIVELGVHTGNSYGAFCQAVQRHGLEAKCFGVDLWQGDEHAGFYGEEVYAELSAWHDARYASFSRLVRASFDEAVSMFAPGSIDLLHIDGLHTYDAVRRDFEIWRDRLSDRAVVLFHDTEVRDRGFGVWRLWEELAADHPGFAFTHGYGLGVLGVGPALPAPVASFFAAARVPAVQDRLRALFARLGNPLMREVAFARAEAELKDAIAAAEAATRAETTARLQAERAADDARRHTAETVAALAETAARLEAVRGSTSWKVTRPLRLTAHIARGRWGLVGAAFCQMLRRPRTGPSP